MRTRIFIGTIIVLLAAAAVTLGVLLRNAQAQLRDAQQRIADITAIPDNIASLKNVVFVRADGGMLTYREPRLDTVDGQTYVNYDEKSASYSPASIQIVGALAHSGVDALKTLPTGTNISILLAADGTSITEIYIPATK